LDEVFGFFSDARNLEVLTPSWLSFKILPPVPITIATGTHIQYRLSWHGVPLRWTTEITLWNPPHEFQDIQLRGPYKLWRHGHGFRELDGGTEMLDRVEYALPLGPLGDIAHVLQVRRNVEQIFDYRKERIEQMFGRPEGRFESL
jgi:hypothetical protein